MGNTVHFLKQCVSEVQYITLWNGKGLMGKTYLSLRAKRKLEPGKLRPTPCKL